MKRKDAEAEAAREVKRKVNEAEWVLKRRPVQDDQRYWEAECVVLHCTCLLMCVVSYAYCSLWLL